MAKITHTYQDQSSFYPSGIDIQLDSNEKICIGNSKNGIKILEYKLLILPSVIWQCDNSSLIEQMFPALKEKFIGSPLELIAKEIMNRFPNKAELLIFLQNYKSNS